MNCLIDRTRVRPTPMMMSPARSPFLNAALSLSTLADEDALHPPVHRHSGLDVRDFESDQLRDRLADDARRLEQLADPRADAELPALAQHGHVDLLADGREADAVAQLARGADRALVTATTTSFGRRPACSAAEPFSTRSTTAPSATVRPSSLRHPV